MSAESCIAYYGLCYEIPIEEVEGLEERSDPRITAARKGGLKYYWGNFGVSGEKYLLFVGSPIGVLGLENELEVQLSDAQFSELAASARANLRAAGLEGEPSLHIRWHPD